MAVRELVGFGMHGLELWAARWSRVPCVPGWLWGKGRVLWLGHLLGRRRMPPRRPPQFLGASRPVCPNGATGCMHCGQLSSCLSLNSLLRTIAAFRVLQSAAGGLDELVADAHTLVPRQAR